ncbi:hypothetical protein Tco_0589317 [Tanacetum coccineum]
MGDENPIRTLRDYSKLSHEGYMNTIELPVGNNIVPLKSDTIRLWTYLTLMVKIGKERACVYFNFPFAIKLATGLNVFQQDPSPHRRIILFEAWTRFKDLLQKVPHHGIDLWLQVQIFCDHVNPVTRRTINQSAGGKLPELNTKESWALLEDLTLYDNESWNDPRDFAMLAKAIALPQDVPSTSDRRLIELENQVQRLMEVHLALTQPTQDWYLILASQDASLSKFEADFKQQQSEMTNKIDTVLKAITDRIAKALPSDTVMNPKLSAFPVLSARSYLNIDP